ncbi:MAG: substrate-binding domain-containing protein [Bacillota bacterium]|nr:substrate-binding domain-containing protein [Bacillota bacterium]MDW7683124.1 substrate-binding domain-containing protein [Bacillota bacterium]
MDRVRLAVILLIVCFLLLLAGCGGVGQSPAQDGRKELILATTTSTYDSGLLEYFLPVFEEKYNYKVKVISLGTGAALELGKNGDCDIVLVHARDAELEMVAQGHYVDRRDVMYNDFVIVGSENDPAGIKTLTGVGEVFRKIAQNEATFVSRGDDSGTHKKELALWDASQVSPDWNGYIVAGSGMADTLRMADEMNGYTITDRATYLSLRDSLDLAVVFEGDNQLFNQYGIMAVNPANYPERDYEGASRLIEFFVSAEGQQLLESFKPYGDSLFFPNAD